MADSMRVGKTTAVGVIAEGLRQHGYTVTESYEDWQHNPYLQKSYEDPAQNFLDSQQWFLRRKWEQLREGGEGIFVQDVPPEMDYGYAETNRRLGRMSAQHFAQYDTYCQTLDWAAVPAPTLLVYLKVSDATLLSRAHASRREFEVIDDTYFLTMKQVNREWLAWGKQHMNILEIDTDTLDFAHEERARQTLLDSVCTRIELG